MAIVLALMMSTIMMQWDYVRADDDDSTVGDASDESEETPSYFSLFGNSGSDSEEGSESGSGSGSTSISRDSSAKTTARAKDKGKVKNSDDIDVIQAARDGDLDAIRKAIRKGQDIHMKVGG